MAKLTVLLTLIFISIFFHSALSESTHSNYFESQGLKEMNNLNNDPMFSQHKYMLAYVSETASCDSDCKESISVMISAQTMLKTKADFTLVYIIAQDSKRVVKSLRIVDFDSIAYLANRKSIIYQNEVEAAQLKKWLKKRIILPSEGYSGHEGLDKMKTNNNRVVTYAGKRNKYYERFRYVASSYVDLHFAHSFSAPVFWDSYFLGSATKQSDYYFPQAYCEDCV